MYTDYLCDKKNGELCTYEGLVDLKCHVLISTTLYLQIFTVHLMHISKGNFSVSQYEYWFGACCLFFYNSKCLVLAAIIQNERACYFECSYLIRRPWA